MLSFSEQLFSLFSCFFNLCLPFFQFFLIFNSFKLLCFRNFLNSLLMSLSKSYYPFSYVFFSMNLLYHVSFLKNNAQHLFSLFIILSFHIMHKFYMLVFNFESLRHILKITRSVLLCSRHGSVELFTSPF